MRRNSVGLGTVHCSVGLGTGGREAPGNSCTAAARCMVHGAWYMVLGAWCCCMVQWMVHGTLCMVLGGWWMVVAWYNWYMVLGVEDFYSATKKKK